MTTLHELTIVIMAFDERDNLPVTVRETVAFLEQHVTSWELLLVDDGSTDGTAEVIDALAAADSRIKALHHPTNRGMGAAIRTGYAAATREWVTLLPADGQIDPTMLARFFPHLGSADIVFSLYDVREDPLVRLALSRVFYTLVRIALGMRFDYTGVMVFRRSLLFGLTLHSDTFFVNFEFPWKALRRGATHRVVTISCRPRLSGRSKVAGVRRLARVLVEMAALRVRGDTPPPPTT